MCPSEFLNCEAFNFIKLAVLLAKFLSLFSMEIIKKESVSQDILLKAFKHMMVAKATADVYE